MSDEFEMEDFFDQLEEDEPKEQFDKQCAGKKVHLGKIEIELVMSAYRVSRVKAVAILKRKNVERKGKSEKGTVRDAKVGVRRGR